MKSSAPLSRPTTRSYSVFLAVSMMTGSCLVPAAGPELLQDGQAVLLREHDVQQDQVGLGLAPWPSRTLPGSSKPSAS